MYRKTNRNRYTTTLLLLTATLAPKIIHAQWDIEESHTTAGLRGIHNVGGGIAWASGTNGTVLRTEDGGYLWQTCNVPAGAEKLDFRGIQAFDENTAIVMSSGPGDQSRLYKTTDGCQTWKLLFTNPDKEGFWDAIHFGPPQNFYNSRRELRSTRHLGVLVGDPVDGKFVIYTTRDAGDTWQRWNADDTKHQPKARPDESLFAASNSTLSNLGNNGPFVFVTGGKGGSHLYVEELHNKAFDSGRWAALTATKLPLLKGETAGAFSIFARRTSDLPFLPVTFTDLMIVGGDYSNPNQSQGTAVFIPGSGLAYSPHTVSAQTPPNGYRSSVAYDPTQKLWITVGPNGTDISTDDGKNWRPLTPSGYDPPDADKNWNALSLPFVVGPHGRIGKLRNITQNPEAHPK